MQLMTKIPLLAVLALILVGVGSALPRNSAAQTQPAQIENSALLVSVSSKTGAYTVREKAGPVRLTADVAAKINGQWVHSADYPKHAVSSTAAAEGTPQLTITHSGLAGQPDLISRCVCIPIPLMPKSLSRCATQSKAAGSAGNSRH